MDCCPLIQSDRAKSICWSSSWVSSSDKSSRPICCCVLLPEPEYLKTTCVGVQDLLIALWMIAPDGTQPTKMPDQLDLSSSLSSSCLRSKLFTEFILKVPLGRLVKQKLDCLIDIVHSDLFTHHGEHTHTQTDRTHSSSVHAPPLVMQ